jgi:hypothetical protein|tara:strand:- start:776 stop:1018 length:243 start_codon:yes stop_codon:yes gene_type:complete
MFYPKARKSDIANIPEAGSDFTMRSPAFICIETAPSNRARGLTAVGRVRAGNQKAAIREHANKVFATPVKIINQPVSHTL